MSPVEAKIDLARRAAVRRIHRIDNAVSQSALWQLNGF
jgi:hypothetical protein